MKLEVKYGRKKDITRNILEKEKHRRKGRERNEVRGKGRVSDIMIDKPYIALPPFPQLRH